MKSKCHKINQEKKVFNINNNINLKMIIHNNNNICHKNNNKCMNKICMINKYMNNNNKNI